MYNYGLGYNEGQGTLLTQLAIHQKLGLVYSERETPNCGLNGVLSESSHRGQSCIILLTRKSSAQSSMARTQQSHGHRDIQNGGTKKTPGHAAKYSTNRGVYCHVKHLIFENEVFIVL